MAFSKLMKHAVFASALMTPMVKASGDDGTFTDGGSPSDERTPKTNFGSPQPMAPPRVPTGGTAGRLHNELLQFSEPRANEPLPNSSAPSLLPGNHREDAPVSGRRPKTSGNPPNWFGRPRRGRSQSMMDLENGGVTTISPTPPQRNSLPVNFDARNLEDLHFDGQLPTATGNDSFREDLDMETTSNVSIKPMLASALVFSLAFLGSGALFVVPNALADMNDYTTTFYIGGAVLMTIAVFMLFTYFTDKRSTTAFAFGMGAFMAVGGIAGSYQYIPATIQAQFLETSLVSVGIVGVLLTLGFFTYKLASGGNKQVATLMGCLTFGCVIIGTGTIAEIWIDNQSLGTSVFHASFIGAGAVLLTCLAVMGIFKLFNDGNHRQGFAAVALMLSGLAACTGTVFHVLDYEPVHGNGLPDMVLLGAASLAIMAMFVFISSINAGNDFSKLTRIANICVGIGGLTTAITTGILVHSTYTDGLTLPAPWVYIGVGGFVGLMMLLGIFFRTWSMCRNKAE